MLLFGDYKIQITCKPEKTYIEGKSGRIIREKGNIREGPREDKTGTILELSLEVRLTISLH